MEARYAVMVRGAQTSTGVFVKIPDGAGNAYFVLDTFTDERHGPNFATVQEAADFAILLLSDRFRDAAAVIRQQANTLP